MKRKRGISMNSSSKLTSVWRSSRTNKLIAVSVTLIVLAAGLAIILTKASGFFAGSEPESGTVATNAHIITDATASGGQAIQFTAPAAPPPSGGGGGGTSCTGPANHVPGGADGTGTCWPGPSNTGVPAGTSLSTYTGSCTITTAGTVIDSKTLNCDLVIQAANVIVKNSKINGQVWLDTDINNSWSLTIQDSEVNFGAYDLPSMGNGNITALRVNVHGGHNGLQCDEHAKTCNLQDSYVHGPIPVTSDPHLGGFLSDGYPSNATTPIRLIHNTIACDAIDGCTGGINLIPNFDSIHGAQVTHNLFVANVHSAFCTVAGDKLVGTSTPHSYNIVYTDNVFQRGSSGVCAAYQAVGGWGWNAGNVWTNNKFTDGADVPPEY